MRIFKFASFLSFVSNLPNVKVQKMKRTHVWRIKYKPGTRYEYSWDIWNHVKSMYETYFKSSITTDDVHLRVYEKYIVIY